MSLNLRNPHSVLAAIQTRPREVLQLCVYDDELNPISANWKAVMQAAVEAGVSIRRVSRAGVRRRGGGGTSEAGGRTARTFARVRARASVSLEELFPAKIASGPSGGLWIALDCLQDPHNVGAIFRTAAFFGVRGIVVTKSRSAPLSETVYDVASGGIEYVPFSVQTNLNRALRIAQQRGLWLLGTSERAECDITEVQPDRPWLLVLGNEEKGLRRLTLEACDLVCRISPRGPVSSLNVSVAAGVLIAALSR